MDLACNFLLTVMESGRTGTAPDMRKKKIKNVKKKFKSFSCTKIIKDVTKFGQKMILIDFMARKRQIYNESNMYVV